jgi:hypothetical protein
MSNRNSPSDGVTGAAMESLEDFKRKLDSEHTTVSAKLDQGVRARQELQELKGKLVEDLESSRKSLQARVEKVEAKLGATSKLKRNKEDQARLSSDEAPPCARFHPHVFLRPDGRMSTWRGTPAFDEISMARHLRSTACSCLGVEPLPENRAHVPRFLVDETDER